MSFIIYDLIFLAVFIISLIIFLYVKRKNLARQGLLYLYRTKIGLKLINYTSKKFSRILYPLQYAIVFFSYLFMIIIVWTIARFSYFYLTSPSIARDLKVPVIIPLIPYLPELFNLDFLPSFPFIYWIIIIALIAIPHEFAHGIFARLNKIPVRATGFGFLGPFLAAFVEPDEKKMEKLKTLPQLAILGAGAFANMVAALILYLILFAFFVFAFIPAGITPNMYALESLPLNQTIIINSTPFIYSSQIHPALNNLSLISVSYNNKTYFTNPLLINNSTEEDLSSYIYAFADTPAFSSKLIGSITKINNNEITSLNKLREVLSSLKPGDNVTIKTIYQKNTMNYPGDILEHNLTLADYNGSAYLGIGFIPNERGGFITSFYNKIFTIKNPNIYYTSLLGSFGVFIYNFLWWAVLISISVALINMLPLGIFDGGRFFYLTVLALTKQELTAKKAFTFSTGLILILIVLLMVKWVFAFL